jgi:hypothetical protein
LYGYSRSDIQALFPGYANTDSSVGVFLLDTTALANGIHTIAWSLCNNVGSCTGIGSRYFTVSNGASSDASRVTVARRTAARATRASAVVASRAPSWTGPALASVTALPADAWPVEGRRGWDPETSPSLLDVSPSGITHLRGEELDLLELRLSLASGETAAGYQRVTGALRPLPAGASFDTHSGVFTWAPGVGFVGRYDLVFVRTVAGRLVARREVRITLAPKRSGHVGAQVVIESPAGGLASAPRGVSIKGWAADLDAAHGPGVDAVHVWAYPRRGAPVFLGAARYGALRPDVGAIHGDAFERSGFTLEAAPLPPGRYTLAVFARRIGRRAFGPATTVQMTIER